MYMGPSEARSLKKSWKDSRHEGDTYTLGCLYSLWSWLKGAQVSFIGSRKGNKVRSILISQVSDLASSERVQLGHYMCQPVSVCVRGRGCDYKYLTFFSSSFLKCFPISRGKCKEEPGRYLSIWKCTTHTHRQWTDQACLCRMDFISADQWCLLSSQLRYAWLLVRKVSVIGKREQSKRGGGEAGGDEEKERDAGWRWGCNFVHSLPFTYTRAFLCVLC